jgi:c-di-GMP-binding flagellar brake protein YcgR
MVSENRDISIRDDLVVETEIDGASVTVPAFVTNILAEELWLATRLPEPLVLSLVDGQPIHLTFDRGGALIVESFFLRRLGAGGRLGMEKSRVFAVKRPEGLENAQRRAHVRIDLERNVRIKALGSLGADQMGSGRTLNLGAGGVQFLTAMPLLFGEQLRLAIVLTSRDIVVVGGTIVRIEDGQQAASETTTDAIGPASALSKVAVRFDKIGAADQERITFHILSAHRQRLKDEPLPKSVEAELAAPTAAMAPLSAAPEPEPPADAAPEATPEATPTAP